MQDLIDDCVVAIDRVLPFVTPALKAVKYFESLNRYHNNNQISERVAASCPYISIKVAYSDLFWVFIPKASVATQTTKPQDDSRGLVPLRPNLSGLLWGIPQKRHLVVGLHVLIAV